MWLSLTHTMYGLWPPFQEPVSMTVHCHPLVACSSVWGLKNQPCGCAITTVTCLQFLFQCVNFRLHRETPSCMVQCRWWMHTPLSLSTCLSVALFLNSTHLLWRYAFWDCCWTNQPPLSDPFSGCGTPVHTSPYNSHRWTSAHTSSGSFLSGGGGVWMGMRLWLSGSSASGQPPGIRRNQYHSIQSVQPTHVFVGCEHRVTLLSKKKLWRQQKEMIGWYSNMPIWQHTSTSTSMSTTMRKGNFVLNFHGK